MDFLFATPNVDVAGQTIDTELCWYNIFVNGELFSLWNDEFLKLPASLDGLSDIPYSFNEDYGLFTRSLLHELFLTSEGIETIGVKGFYQATEETILETDLVTLDLASGEITTQDDSAIRNLSAENAKITTTEYYNLQGQRIEHPRAGEIAVVRHIMSDGSVKTSKTIIK